MKVDTRNLEKEIEALKQEARWYYHAYEENEESCCSGNNRYDEVIDKLCKKERFLEALKKVSDKA